MGPVGTLKGDPFLAGLGRFWFFVWDFHGGIWWVLGGFLVGSWYLFEKLHNRNGTDPSPYG